MTSARIAGGIVGIVALALLAVVVVMSFGEADRVVPEVSVSGVSGEDTADRVVAAEALIRRSNLLGDRVDAVETRGVDIEAAEDSAPRIEFRPGVAAPEQLADSWAALNEDEATILTQSQRLEGTSSLPYRNAASFEQPGGRDWRGLHNDQIRYGGGWIIFGVLAVLGMFLFVRGRVEIVEGKAGTTVERFTAVERANHWMTASAFVLLAITGLVLLYGKPLLIPLIGEPAFGDLAYGSAWLHMASAVPFVVGVILMAVLWLMENLPSKLDWVWLKHGGGMLRDDGKNPPARKMNAGQKIVFWGVVLGGATMLASGAALMYPFLLFGYDGMQSAQIVHAVVGILMVALIFGHIYIGTIGMVGAFDAMWSGRVDRNWAKEHHSLWYRKIVGESDEHRAEPPRKAGEAQQ